MGERILADPEFFPKDFAKSFEKLSPGTGKFIPKPYPDPARIEKKYGEPDESDGEVVSIEGGPTILLFVKYYGSVGLGVADDRVRAIVKKK